MDTLAFILIFVALLIGGGIGWFVGSRPVADWKARFQERDGEAKEIDRKFRQAIVDLEGATVRASRAESLEGQLLEVTEARRVTETELAAMKSESTEREKGFRERFAEREQHYAGELKRLAEAEDSLQAKFNDISEKLLEGARSKFLESAQIHLTSLNKDSLDALEKKVGPVGDTLERYRKRVEELEKSRVTDFQQLRGVIGEVRDGQQRVVDGANKITTTLRGATKARGDWGELQFENLLESCGLRDATDFDFQANVKDEEGANLRPDAVINIPGGRKLIVDVKNVFNTYVAANEAETEEQRTELLRGHAREVRKHIDELSAKRYQDFVDGSADFVVMFIPGEHVLYSALSMDSGPQGGLLDYALKKGVVLSSPLNFMSIALTVATIWRQAGVQADAEEIAKLGKELYDRLSTVAERISALRRSLGTTNTKFDDVVKAFDGNLRVTGERFEKLNIDTSAKELERADPLQKQPRLMRNFADPDEVE